MAKTKKRTQAPRTQGGVNDQTFDLIMARFDTIEGQNVEQLRLQAAHIKDDNKVHRIVERHSAYFGILSFGIPAAMAYVGTKLGVKIN
jgi:hypothetical protein